MIRNDFLIRWSCDPSLLPLHNTQKVHMDHNISIYSSHSNIMSALLMAHVRTACHRHTNNQNCDKNICFRTWNLNVQKQKQHWLVTEFANLIAQWAMTFVDWSDLVFFEWGVRLHLSWLSYGQTKYDNQNRLSLSKLLLNLNIWLWPPTH